MSRRAMSGFTVVELLIASTVAIFLFAVVHELLFAVANLSEIMISRVRMNQEAREIFRTLSEGGAVDVNSSGTIGDAELIAGIHGSASISANSLIPYSTSVQRIGQRLKLLNVASSASVLGMSLPVTVSCTAVGVPHPDCTGAVTLNADGLLSADPAITSMHTLSVTDRCNASAANNNLAASVSISFTDPRLMFHDDEFSAGDYTDAYKTFVALHVDCRQ